MSRNKVRIHSGDTVVVISGKERGKTGRVIAVDPDTRRVKVEGVRVVKRHMKPVGDQPGGIVHKEAYIDVSNVAFYDAENQRRIKLGYAFLDGRKVRVDRKTGQPVDKE